MRVAPATRTAVRVMLAIDVPALILFAWWWFGVVLAHGFTSMY